MAIEQTEIVNKTNKEVTLICKSGTIDGKDGHSLLKTQLGYVFPPNDGSVEIPAEQKGIRYIVDEDCEYSPDDRGDLIHAYQINTLVALF